VDLRQPAIKSRLKRDAAGRFETERRLNLAPRIRVEYTLGALSSLAIGWPS
jgi:hypothetical protein